MACEPIQLSAIVWLTGRCSRRAARRARAGLRCLSAPLAAERQGVRHHGTQLRELTTTEGAWIVAHSCKQSAGE